MSATPSVIPIGVVDGAHLARNTRGRGGVIPASQFKQFN